ncbi:MAG: ATP-binding protein [Nocardioidaceae bacterium]
MPETIRLEHGIAAPMRARRWISRQCREWGCDDVADRATVIVSELVTNVFLHAGTSCRVEAELVGSELAVAVRDGHPEPLPPPQPDDISGRGLLIVSRLSDAWGVTDEGPEKSIWFRLATAEATTAVRTS